MDNKIITWDLLQDTQGLIALFHARLSQKHLVAQASLAVSTLDPYSVYCFVCPEFKVICEIERSNLPVGSFYIAEHGDPEIKLPIAYLELYPSYLDYLKSNVEGKTRQKVERKSRSAMPLTTPEFNIGSETI